MDSTPNRDYYCNFKFKFLKIDLTSSTIYNCHAAKPHKIDYEWLEDESNDLFNTQTSTNERTMMLRNERNDSCEQNCWHIEDNGGSSPRLWQGGAKKSHSEIITNPEIIDLTISKNCNLTCSYCCKEFSTSWIRDIVNNGEYVYTNPDDDLSGRNKITLRDNISLKVKQNDLKKSIKYKILVKQIVEYSDNLEELIITGGEPFVDNDLFDVLEQINMKKGSRVVLYTGLGISLSRFKRYINTIKNIKGPTFYLRISGDGIGKHLEFNRYGIKWNEYNEKIEFLKKQNINFEFQSTLSNLSVFGFNDFYNMFHECGIRLTFSYIPRMMPIYVMDDESKNMVVNQIKHMDEDFKSKIISSILPSPSELQRIQIKEFLEQFIERRVDLSLDIFPRSFIKWIGI